MVRRSIAALVGLYATVALSAQAAPAGAERTGVAGAVARYVNAIACAGVRVTPADVLVLARGYPDASQARYAVLWNGDMACAGGGEPDKTQLTIAAFSAGEYVVRPELSTPVVAFESPVRRVSRIVSYNARVLVLEGMENGPGDADDAPTVPVRFMLRVDGKGNWVLVDKVFLAPPVHPQ